MLITRFGAAGVGVAILAACGSDDDGASDSSAGSDGTSPPATDAPATDPPPTEAPAESVADAAESAVPDEIRLQHVSLGFVSAYVLARGDEALVVDTGTEGSAAAIVDGAAALGLGPSDVKHIVVTHRHSDHVGGLDGLDDEITSATVYAGAGDIAGVQTSLALQEVGDGDEVLGMGVIETPGHTPGSISLFDTGTGILVAGDAINGDGAGGLVGANADFSDDMTAAAASVGVLAALQPSVAAFGHGGPPVTDDVAAQLAALA
jgi:glyoxylase-like metal-dependent hydrolase (beta-lactamase superfamily II)